MICLDTNYLVRALIPGTREARLIADWLGESESLGISAVAWYEFLCGPVTDEEILIAQTILAGNVLHLDQSVAAEAARLFNAAKRKRSLRIDAMIAGTATAVGARLATNNRADFKPFVAHGLRLI